jgi:hypothetical protein
MRLSFALSVFALGTAFANAQLLATSSSSTQGLTYYECYSDAVSATLGYFASGGSIVTPE